MGNALFSSLTTVASSPSSFISSPVKDGSTSDGYEQKYQRLVLSLKRNQNRLFLSGEVARVNEVTRNGRVFTRNAMAKAMEAVKLPMFGRLEHPECDASDAESVERYRRRFRCVACCSKPNGANETPAMTDAVSLDGIMDHQTSHVVHDLYFNGNAVVVVVEVLECTEVGRKVREVYEKAGGLVGASMRAWGSSTEAALDVDSGGIDDGGASGGNAKNIRAVCEEGFELITIDLVANPSHTLAYLQPHLGNLVK